MRIESPGGPGPVREGGQVLSVRVLMLGLLGFLLSIKSDRLFPLSPDLAGPLFLPALFLYTVIFFLVVLVFLRPGILLDRVGPLGPTAPLTLAAAIALVFEAITAAILLLQNGWYAGFGYDLSLPLAAGLFLGIGILLVYGGFRVRTPVSLFACAITAYAVTALLSIASFPLHPGRSDMLPLIVSGGRSFLTGVLPYGFHDIPHHLVFTYLPGMWLPYLPAVAFGFDPRLISLACTLAAAIIIVYAAGERRVPACLLLSVFLLVPYFQYRHDLYLGVLFLALAVLFALFSRRRWYPGSATLGYAMATYQFSWVIAPFAIVSVFRQAGLRRALISSGIAAGTALLLILPFFLADQEAFVAGIYGHWMYESVMTVNLSTIVTLLLPWDLLVAVQAAVLLALFVLALRSLDPGDTWGWMAGALLLVISLNRVIEVYFYLIVLLLLALHGIAAPGCPGSSGLAPAGET